MINMNVQGKEIYRGIVVYDNVLEATEEIINVGKEDDRWVESKVFIDGEQKVSAHDRETQILLLPPTVDHDPMWYFIAKALKGYGYIYANSYRAFFQSMEFPQMLHYPENTGFYTDHVDSEPGIQRIFSAVLYLNTVEEGGETHFPDIGVSVKPVAGRLVMFPANYLYRHQALPPISNEKFCIVTWYREDNG
jgi:hypothetical protein